MHRDDRRCDATGGVGMKLAQEALSYGADDLYGTIIEEHIFHVASAISPKSQRIWKW